jgi:hypothetical protein
VLGQIQTKPEWEVVPLSVKIKEVEPRKPVSLTKLVATHGLAISSGPLPPSLVAAAISENLLKPSFSPETLFVLLG